MCRAPHASGLLDGTSDARAAQPYADERLGEGIRRLKALEFLTHESEATLGQAAIQFVLANKLVASALPTVARADRLREFVAAADLPGLGASALSCIVELYESGFDPEAKWPERGGR